MPKLDKTKGRAIHVAVGRRVRLRRQILGLTQSAVAEHLGMSFQQVQKYENGTDQIAASRLYQLSLLFNVPIDYFFGDLQRIPKSEGDAQDQDAAQMSDMALTRQGMKVASAYMRIPDEKIRRQVANLVEELGQAKE